MYSKYEIEKFYRSIPYALERILFLRYIIRK